VIIGLLFALFNSRKISEPVDVIRRDIHDIRLLKEIPEREFDITEFAEISKDVSNASRALGSQEDYKRQWLRDLAHDLRTPLSGLKSQFEAIADGVLEATPERFRRHLLEIERLERLATSIGELTSIEEREPVEKNAIYSKRFIDRLTAPFEAELANKKIDLAISIDTEKIYGDENLLLRGIGNIFSNALNYIEENGRIWIKINEEGIEIANNGPDIPEDQLDLIFTRLFRGDFARSTPGSGLGLSITREIVNLHGGEIRVLPLEPRGVRFIVSLGK
jgi:signal transduction histidine kinase